MHVLVFDIETVPDVEAGRRLYGLDGVSDSDVAKAMQHLRRQATGGSDFLQMHLHRVVAISLALRTADTFKVWSLGDSDETDEADLVKRFFEGVAKYSPRLVTWNGSGFDLPVLHYRALRHGISAPRYWETGEEDRDFRWNNYLNRFHERHTDLMDVLSGYQMRAVAPLQEVATMLGFPGKMGMDGSKVWQSFQDDDISAIRDYCETDVLNTYLIYLRFELMRGRFTLAEYQDECRRLRENLRHENRPHLNEFLKAWEQNADPVLEGLETSAFD